MVQAEQDHTRVYKRGLPSQVRWKRQQTVSEHAHICGATRAQHEWESEMTHGAFGPGALVKEQASVLVLCSVYV